jgi:hypothetical protein
MQPFREHKQLFTPIVPFDRYRTSIQERGAAAKVTNRPLSGKQRETARQFPNDVLLPGTELVHVDPGRGKLDAPMGSRARFKNDTGDVKQRLRRNAAPIKADAAGILLSSDQGDFQAQISSHERSGITARTGPDDC